jgi:hypothetical protein
MPPEVQYQEAEWYVPHARFEVTDNGFRVRFRRVPARYAQMIGKLQTGQEGTAAIGGLFALIIVATVGLGVLIRYWLFPTVIEVSSDAVTINRKVFKRKDFGSFTVAENWEMDAHQMATLGYTYGLRSFSFGGAWIAQEAEETANALNRLLRALPRDDAEYVSAETLRAGRPTAF